MAASEDICIRDRYQTLFIFIRMVFHFSWLCFIPTPSWIKLLLFLCVLVCFFLPGRLFNRLIKLSQKYTSESSFSGLFNNLVSWSISLTVFFYHRISSWNVFPSLFWFPTHRVSRRFHFSFLFRRCYFSTRAFPFPSTSTTLLSGLGEARCVNSMSVLPSDSSLETVSCRNYNCSKYLQAGNFDDLALDLCFKWRFWIHLL